MGSKERKRRAGRRLVAVCAVAVAALLAACAPAPAPPTLWAPGTYRADVWAPPPGGTYGQATVRLCVASSSAVRLETAPLSEPGVDGEIGRIVLDWHGTRYEAITDSGVAAVTLITPVIGPGCGTLTFNANCCYVEQFLAVRATLVAPADQ